MNNIYKRQPIQHQLPYRWSDMDGTQLYNISNMKGLQHHDNPFASDQNSTYNCKNVYQDESGNLAIRPAVRYLRTISTGVIGVYDTTDGEIIHSKSGSSYYLTRGNAKSEIGKGRVTIQESDGYAYVLYTDTAGYLQFKRCTKSNSGSLLESFEPDIPLNLPEQDSRLLNLLSSKTKYIVSSILPNHITSDLFSDLDSTYISDSNALAIHIAPDNTVVLVYTNKVVVCVPYGSAYRTFELPANTPEKSYIVIDDLAGGCVIDASYDAMFDDDDDDTTDIVKLRHIVQYNGGIKSESWSVKRPVDYRTHMVGYDDTLFIASVITDPLDSSQYTLSVKRYVSGVERTKLSYEYAFSPASKSIFAWIGASKTGFVVLAYSLPHEKLYTDAWSFEYLDSPNDSKTGKYYPLLEFAKNISADEVNNISVISNKDHWYIVDSRSNLIYYDRPYYEYELGTNALVKPDPISVPFTLPGADSIYPVQDGLIIQSNADYYYIGPERNRSYNINGSVVFNYDSTVIVESRPNGGYSIQSRKVAPQYLTVDRDISDSIPLLSQIQDEVVTSFYLDNIHWFVTKHRVFGTGVADEKFSIKYFDPRKYFHFDEQLTGAIRVSDTGFWVFHNSGSYLIYKSTSQVYDTATETYITVPTWLCTAAAASKGCDFENALITLPVTSYVASVTSDDISYVAMRENVQTDDRILLPMTLQLQQFVSSLLAETESVVIANYKYNAVFFLNSASGRSVSALVYNAATESWWYWELPFDKVIQAKTTETNIVFIAESSSSCNEYDLYTEYYKYTMGGLTYEVYADRVFSQSPTRIDWFWESALLHFGNMGMRKQLLSTIFSLSERSVSDIEFEYNFEIYDNEYSNKDWSEVYTVVERAQTYTCRTNIASFKYIQLYIKNQTKDEYSAYVKPKFNSISFKYRLLSGGTL